MAPMAVLAVVSLVALAHPNPLVLPILSAILVIGALVVYFVRRLAARRRGIPAGDGMLLPALMLFFGFAAAIFSDSERVAQSLAALAQ
ncbi:MAG: hypothetical protein SFW09_13780 [Hyphomicrobiaceae bacterium]|nr:hypothetical protein [Hyphomicrobiaceae bacterium]